MQLCERRMLLAGDLSSGLLDLFADDQDVTIAIATIDYTQSDTYEAFFRGGQTASVTPFTNGTDADDSFGGVSREQIVLLGFDAAIEDAIANFTPNQGDNDRALGTFLPDPAIEPFTPLPAAAQAAASLAVGSADSSPLISLAGVLQATHPSFAPQTHEGLPLADATSSPAGGIPLPGSSQPGAGGDLFDRDAWDRMWAFDLAHLTDDAARANARQDVAPADAARDSAASQPSNIGPSASLKQRAPAPRSAASYSLDDRGPIDDSSATLTASNSDSPAAAARDAAFAHSATAINLGVNRGNDWQGMLDRRNAVAAGFVAALVAGKAWHNGLNARRGDRHDSPQARPPRRC